jgi:hypothetical protein
MFLLEVFPEDRVVLFDFFDDLAELLLANSGH